MYDDTLHYISPAVPLLPLELLVEAVKRWATSLLDMKHNAGLHGCTLIKTSGVIAIHFLSLRVKRSSPTHFLGRPRGLFSAVALLSAAEKDVCV